jgi:ligand-binding SRPBCC domain-containing protein
MKTYSLRREIVVARPIDEVFAFFERPENLAKITPPSLGFHILTPSPINMGVGTLIDYTIKVLGLRRHWTTLIAEYDPPRRFVDVQLKGPYTFWHHTHLFEPVGDGTRITDVVRYVVPFGFLGQLANALVIRRQLSHIFAFRAEVLAKLLDHSESPGDLG